MNTATMSNLHNGAVQQGTATYSIGPTIGELPVQWHRQAMYMHFSVSETAEGIRLVKDAVKLDVLFSELEFDVLEPIQSSLFATLEHIDSKTVGVQFDTSRNIKKVFLSPNQLSQGGYRLAFYNYDGSLVAGEAMKVTDVVNGVAELDNAVSASQLAIRKESAAGALLPFGPGDIVKLVGEQSDTVILGTLDNKTRTIDLKVPRRVYQIQFTAESTIPTGSRLEFYRLDLETPAEKPTVGAEISNYSATLADEFIAVCFAVRIKQNDDAFCQDNHWNIEKITVHSYPTGPRLAAHPGSVPKASPPPHDSPFPHCLHALHPGFQYIIPHNRSQIL